MNDRFAPPQIHTMDGTPPPEAPRRLLNERVYRDRVDDMPERPMMASRKKVLRFHETMSQILVNDVGMVQGTGTWGRYL